MSDEKDTTIPYHPQETADENEVVEEVVEETPEEEVVEETPEEEVEEEV